MNNLLNYDFVVLTETKCNDIDTEVLSDKLDKLGYFILYKNIQKLSVHRSGRIAIFASAIIKDKTKLCPLENPACLWFFITKSIFGYDKDVLCGVVYIPPEGSKYSDVGLFDDLSLNLVHMSPDNKYYVLIILDFNSRTANQSDVSQVDFMYPNDISDDTDNPVLDGDTLASFSIPETRCSDKICNNYGNRLIDFCKSSSICIFNARIGSDNLTGEFTTIKNSVIDYCISSPNLLSYRSEYNILDFDPLFSDIHSGTDFESKARRVHNVVPQFISENPVIDTKDNNENMYIWDNCKKTQFIEAIDNSKIEVILKKLIMPM